LIRFSSSLPVLLTPTEKAFIDGTREITNSQKSYIRCRLNKKKAQASKYRIDRVAAATLQRMNVIAATVVLA
jgi:hypothetical protein